MKKTRENNPISFKKKIKAHTQEPFVYRIDVWFGLPSPTKPSLFFFKKNYFFFINNIYFLK
jgi:hypothetical protein